jgi:protein NRD1
MLETVKNPMPPVTRVETQALPIITTPPPATPSQGPTPPLSESVQSTLLALLEQAKQAAGHPRM